MQSAYSSAKAAGYETVLDDFGKVVATSSTAVIARPLMTLQRIVDNSNLLLMNFYKEVEAGGRTAENNDWDKGRGQIDGLINPNYYKELHFAALSLNGEGVRHYGDFHITLASNYISDRASVFEENPFKFGQRHKIVVGQSCPPGYRAPWGSRGKLAQAKLFPQLTKDSKEADYPAILINQATSRGEEDFIEVHIFGTIGAGTIERIVAYEPKGHERHIWRALKRTLDAAGIAVEVRS
ncbi:MAG: hypothetical protein E5X76_18005 [Mesorhizobium sp.]|nr:MAG: hypothetical protein E5X76_18005 [Mesorhizobium sp.]